jgi:uncharacterized C2H2 Zn-finger protein
MYMKKKIEKERKRWWNLSVKGVFLLLPAEKSTFEYWSRFVVLITF